MTAMLADRPTVAVQAAPWLVCRVLPQRWQAFLDDCREFGVEAYLPLKPVEIRRRMVGGKRMAFDELKPAYPGYGFLAAPPGVAGRRLRGYQGLCMIGYERPMTIRGAEVAALRVCEAAWHRDHAADLRRLNEPLVPGERVRIVSGLFAGQEGTVADPERSRAVVVTLDDSGVRWSLRSELVARTTA